jgi:hypothetical protein
LIEPLLVQTILNRFRSFNVVAGRGVAPATPITVAQMLAQPRSVSSVVAAPIVAPKAINLSSVPAALSATPVPTATLPGATQPLVQPASRSPVDIALQAQDSDDLSKYIAAIAHAIVVAHDNWRQTAFLRGVQITGPTATGGSISGPPLSAMLIPLGPSQGLSGNAAAYTAAIGNGLASAWQDWQQSVRVPGLMWYPSFAAVPAPQAPPVSNIPTPMIALTYSLGTLSTNYLTSVISSKLAKPLPYSDALIASVAEGFSQIIAAWLPTQLITGVLGKGPVPTFAPPYVPVGMVLGGSTIEAPAHFAS